MIDQCIEDALQRLTPVTNGEPIHKHEYKVYAWPQTWSNTSCGFEGLCGQAITTKQTVVVIGPRDDACVYHNEKFAYRVESVYANREEFFKLIQSNNVPGKDQFEKRFQHATACV